jgi:hypothetical protein
VEKVKEYAWSCGLGIEISPIKTRSSRKKIKGGLVPSEGKDISTSDSGALRALKALEKEK